MPRSILSKTGRVLTFVSLVMASLMLALPAHAKGPMIPLSVGNWSGGSYLNDRTEKFSHCAASARIFGAWVKQAFSRLKSTRTGCAAAR
jgi:hypothetical protein